MTAQAKPMPPRRQHRYGWRAIIAIGALGLNGCAVNAPPVNPPEYLRNEIREHEPDKHGPTVYATRGPYGGEVTLVARSGHNETVIASTPKEIFRSGDGGRTWAPASIELDNKTVNDIIAVGNLFFAGTDGIFRSADDGASWQRMPAPGAAQPKVNQLLLFGEQLLAATDQGLLRSDRRGERWSVIKPTKVSYDPKKASLNNFTQSDFSFLAVSGDRVLAGDINHVLSSQDLQTWEAADRGLNLSPPDVSEVLLEKLLSKGDVLFAVVGGFGVGRFPVISKLYRSTNHGASWAAVPEFREIEIEEAFAAGESLFIFTRESVRRQRNGTWQDLDVPPPGLIVHDLIQSDDTVLIATSKGIYVSDNGTGLWKINNTGLRGSRSAGTFKTVGGLSFVVLNSELYRSKDNGESWNLIPLSREGLRPRQGAPAIADVEELGGQLFATTTNGIYRGKVEGGGLTRLPTQPLTKGYIGRSMIRARWLTVADNALVVSVGGQVFRTKDYGDNWEPISEGLKELPSSGSRSRDGPFTALEAVGETLFLSYRDEKSEIARVFRLPKGKNRWEELRPPSLSHVTALAAAGDTVYAGASHPAPDESSVTLPPAQLFKLEQADSGTEWEPAKTDGVTGEVHALWVDPGHQEVILAGTTDGLFWSSDGMQQFSEVKQQGRGGPFRQVGAIAYQQGQLYLNTDKGVFYLYDQIPRGKWYAQWLERINRLPDWLFSVTALAILLMIVLSTRMISLLLKLDIWGINQVAPAFYLFAPFGRWKLYRGYRKRVLSGAGLNADLKYGVEHYIDLPFDSGGTASDAVKLSDFFTKLPVTKRAVVVAEGGRGKSTLCYYLARRCVERGDVFGGKRLEPVVVDGLTYTGDMLQAITGALSKEGAYVNKGIVESQAAAGNLLVIFEGFSEIREAYRDAASSGELPNFVRQHQDTPFIFTSRSDLPPALLQALGDPLTIRLRDVDETTERLFLSQYLKRGTQEVDALMSQIKERFSDLPRIPLMLKLVAAVYDEKGQVPKDTAALFHDYTEQVLREKATGIKFTNGLHYAINYLVRETYLRSGGDRGLTENRGVELLRQIKDELEAREIKLSPISLLYVLVRAGLYKQVGRHLKFFHDSFESYFGARALESDFSDGKYELLKQCLGNERLSETSRFLNEILEEPADKHKLDSLLREKRSELAKPRT